MRFLAVACGVIAAVVLTSCGSSDDDSSAASTTEPTTTPRADVMDLGFVACERMGMATSVDPAIAGGYLPEDLGLFLTEEGQARFAFHALDCDDLVTDGKSHGPGRFNTAWIRVTGPEEPPTLPQDSDLVTGPTDYFHPALFDTDNEGFQQATAGFGIPMTLADEITFDPTAEGTQTGSTTDSEFEPPLSLRWSAENTNWADREDSDAIHTLLGPDDRGEALTYFGVFTQGTGWQLNPGDVSVEPETAFADLLGEGFAGIAKNNDIEIDMTVFRSSN